MPVFVVKRLSCLVVSILILLSGCIKSDKPVQQALPPPADSAAVEIFDGESTVPSAPVTVPEENKKDKTDEIGSEVKKVEQNTTVKELEIAQKAPIDKSETKKLSQQVQKNTGSELIVAKMKSVGDSQQVILVSAGSFKSNAAKLSTYEKLDGKWREVVSPVKAMIGRNGFSNSKKEGDGKSPVGRFALRTCYGRAGNPGTKMNFITFGENAFWVDDSNSKYYNTFQQGPANGRWESAEDLYKIGGRYKYFVAIEYNTVNVVRGKGSAIFLHIWEGENIDTSGCIAISENNLLKIMKWLDPAKKPLIIQGPASELNKM